MKCDAPFQLAISASSSMPMAVSDGEKRYEDRQQRQTQIIEDWLDNYLPADKPQDRMKRKSDKIAGEESGDSSQSKKPKGVKTTCKSPSD